MTKTELERYSQPIGTREIEIHHNGEKHWYKLTAIPKNHSGYNHVRKGFPKVYWVHDCEGLDCLLNRVSKRLTGTKQYD